MEPLKVNRKGDKIKLEGTFLELENNDRKYDMGSVIYNLTQIQHEIGNGNLLGELDHPDRNEVSLANVSHKITNLWLDPAIKELKGSMTILDGTPKGQMAKKLIDSGAPLSVAMRASGKVNKDNTIDIDKIYSFDLVQHNANDMATNVFNKDYRKPYSDEMDQSEEKFQDSIQDYLNSTKNLKLKDTPEKRRLLVFAIYVPVGVQSESKARTRLREIKQEMQSVFNKLASQSDCIITTFVFPSKDDTSKMECVYSGDINYFPAIDEEPKGFSVGDEIDGDYPKQYGSGPQKWNIPETDALRDFRTQIQNLAKD